MLCKDPLVDTLQEFGYNLVRLPRTNLAPLLILVREQRDLEVFGGLGDVLGAGAELPAVTRDVAVASLAGKRAKSSAVALDVGLGFLGAVLTAVGGSSLGLDLAFGNASTVTFEFHDPLQDEIRLVDLDRVLSANEPGPETPQLARLIASHRIFVTTATLKCRKFSVEARSSTGGEVGIDASRIHPVVGGALEVKTDRAETSTLVYEGDAPLVFGFQAVRLRYGMRGRFRGFERVAPGEVMLRTVAFTVEPAVKAPELSVLQVPGSTFLELGGGG